MTFADDFLTFADVSLTFEDADVLQALMGVGLRAPAIDTIVTIDIHKYCSDEFLMLKKYSKKTINHKNLGRVSRLFYLRCPLDVSKAILHVILGWLAYEKHSMEYGQNRFSTLPHMKDKTS